MSLDTTNASRWRWRWRWRWPMIKRFKCRETQALFEGKRTPRFSHIAIVALRKLQMLHAVERLESLRIPPQNRLEALKGKRKGRWSIRANDKS